MLQKSLCAFQTCRKRMVVPTSHPFTRIFYVLFHFHFGKQSQLFKSFPHPVLGYLISLLYRGIKILEGRQSIPRLFASCRSCNALHDSDTRYDTFYNALKCLGFNSLIYHSNLSYNGQTDASKILNFGSKDFFCSEKGHKVFNLFL